MCNDITRLTPVDGLPYNIWHSSLATARTYTALARRRPDMTTQAEGRVLSLIIRLRTRTSTLHTLRRCMRKS